jgi:hypothetical protein
MLCFLTSAFSELVGSVTYNLRRPYSISPPQQRQSVSAANASEVGQSVNASEAGQSVSKESHIAAGSIPSFSQCIDLCLQKAAQVDEWE